MFFFQAEKKSLSKLNNIITGILQIQYTFTLSQKHLPIHAIILLDKSAAAVQCIQQCIYRWSASVMFKYYNERKFDFIDFDSEIWVGQFKYFKTDDLQEILWKEVYIVIV